VGGTKGMSPILSKSTPFSTAPVSLRDIATNTLFQPSTSMTSNPYFGVITPSPSSNDFLLRVPHAPSPVSKPVAPSQLIGTTGPSLATLALLQSLINKNSSALSSFPGLSMNEMMPPASNLTAVRWPLAGLYR
jgi:hypothetical protein